MPGAVTLSGCAPARSRLPPLSSDAGICRSAPGRWGRSAPAPPNFSRWRGGATSPTGLRRHGRPRGRLLAPGALPPRRTRPERLRNHLCEPPTRPEADQLSSGMCAGAGRSGQRGSAAGPPGRRRGARARKHVGAKPNHVGLGREARAAAAPRLRAADRSPLRRLQMTATKALRPWPRRSAARTWTFGASNRGKSPRSLPAPPAGTLAPLCGQHPARTDRAGARRR